MNTKKSFIELLWDERNGIKWLLFFSALLLLTMLGARELWTQEWRWANISWNMMFSGDYFHPYLAGAPYYDKPLLSYWVMIAFAHVLNGLSTWSLRLPAALSGILAIFCTYRLGTLLVSKRMGLVAGWMLLTSFYFIFWARTANSDMFNVAGIMLATMWYFERREKPGFVSYSIFFLVLAVSALFKGLIAPVTVVLAILPDLLVKQNWKKHLRFSLLPALIPAALIYAAPFIISSHIGGAHYGENGFYEVYRENILRYFQPFDHEDPIYCYFIYLPAYMFPWALFFIPALFALRKRWGQMSDGSRWMVWSTLIIFLFLTLSGSRRNYYVLPLVPFATLLTADWIAASFVNQVKRLRLAAYTIIASYLLLFTYFDILEPIYYSNGGLPPFVRDVQKAATTIRPWAQWNILFLDTENKLTLYIQPEKPITILEIPNKTPQGKRISRKEYTGAQLVKVWPQILQHQPNTILVSRKLYLEKLQPYLKNYKVIAAQPSLGVRLLHQDDSYEPVAFIPVK
jgi:4-amino-4-deoxy-L-arabinose transferase-like glycosyltransferase